MDRQEFKNGEGRVSYPDSLADGYDWTPGPLIKKRGSPARPADRSEAELIQELREHRLAEKAPIFFRDSTQDVFDEALRLLRRKHEDYGPKNISDAPGGPLNGLRVRMYDKIARINHLVDNGLEPQHESLRDSLLDLANYALIGVMVLDGTWPA